MSRLSAVVVLLSVILIGTVSPAEACAIWCLGSHGGHEHHEVAASGMVGHHHAGMGHARPGSSSSFASRLCGANCSAAFVAREGRSLAPVRLSSGLNPRVREVVGEAAENDGIASVHFEVAGPPGLASCGKSILRI